MSIQRFIKPQFLHYNGDQIQLLPIDQHCNSIKLEIKRKGIIFSEVISIYDVVNMKEMMKQGKSMKQINEMSLLFIKLLISVQIEKKQLKIMQLKEVPLAKVLKKKQNFRKQWQYEGIIQDTKGLALKLKQDFIIILPKMLIDPPKKQKDIMPISAERKIKSQFFTTLS